MGIRHPCPIHRTVLRRRALLPLRPPGRPAAGRTLPHRCAGRHLTHGPSIHGPSTHTAKDTTVTNPFENNNAPYFVLRNAEGQHSLWPASVDVPEGWDTVFGEAGRQECLDYVESSWTDMRPKSLADAMADS
ncbi:MbtH family NRPS accessory protein [Streptomyces sp. SID4936]|nr:MbtH family NRPS accessory protein [Streptomyces sp. SID4936]